MRYTEPEMSVKVFISYAYANQEIPTGANPEDQISTLLNEADPILLLISASFIASQHCWSKEVEIALRRHKERNAQIIPIILRPVHWQDTPLGPLQVLPTEAKPITQWNNPDEAFQIVIQSTFDCSLNSHMLIIAKYPLDLRDVILMHLGQYTANKWI